MRTWAVVGGLALVCASLVAQSRQPSTIVFVCEHGSAKSVIAAAHFNRLAEARGLSYRAISRGVHPDAEIPANIKLGLSGDGLNVNSWTPKLISDNDLRGAERVITLACELPKSKSSDPRKTVDWANIPPVSNGYQEARAAIVQKIEELLTTLPGAKLPPR